MADRSLWPAAVELHAQHLQYETTSRITSQRGLLNAMSTGGVLSGLTVTVNGTLNTRIDIAAGSGYVPNGDLVSLSGSVLSTALADYTNGTKNYVVLMYDELQSFPEADETTGTTKPTRATTNPRVVVLTATQYNALPTTDSVLTNNAKDRALVLAIVTAGGVGVQLTSGSIELPTTFTSTLQVTQPTNITGVTIKTIDSSTLTGTGVLAWTALSSTLTWTAPGDIAGAAVTISVSSEYTIASANGRTIVVDITFTSLPVVDKTDNITITNLYAQTIPRFTDIDIQHRSMVGSGLPTPTNPHGLSLDDLGPSTFGTLQDHQAVEHANGLSYNSSAALVASVDTGASPDRMVYSAFSTGNEAYVAGNKITAINGSNAVTFSDGTVTQALYGIYLGITGSLIKYVRAQYPGGGTSLLFDKTQIVNVSPDIGSATKNLTWTNGGNLQFDGGPTKAAPTSAPDVIIRLYAANRVSWIDVYAKKSATPGSTQTDVITFAAEPDLGQNLPLTYVAWSGSASGFLGYGFGAANSPNGFIDRRVFGNTSASRIATDAGYTDVSAVVRELIGDGIYARTDGNSVTANDQTTVTSAQADQFSLGSPVALAATLEGGVVYVNGVRHDIDTTTINYTDNTQNNIYIDHTGTVSVSTSSWDTILANQARFPVIRLFEITLAAGAETVRTDLRTYTGLIKNAQLGSVGLDINKKATWTAVSGDALVVIGGTSNGRGAVFTSGGSGGSGVVGAISGATVTPGTTAAVAGYSTGAIYAGYFEAQGTGVGIQAKGGATSGTGALITGGPGSYGVDSTGGSGFPGAKFTAGSGSANGIDSYGSGNGGGGHFIAGTASSGAAQYNAIIANAGNVGFINVVNPNYNIGATNVLAPINIPKVWIKLVLNGSVTPAINDAFNVSSVTATGGGTNVVTINFASNFANTDYMVFGNVSTFGNPKIFNISSQAVGSCDIQLTQINGASITQVDPTNAGFSGVAVHIAFFGRQ